MKSKNNKPHPFSPCLTPAESSRPTTLLLSFAVNTAQKIHNFTAEMIKLGTLKNEQTKPTTNPRNARRLNYFRVKYGVENKAEIHAILGCSRNEICHCLFQPPGPAKRLQHMYPPFPGEGSPAKNNKQQNEPILPQVPDA